MALKAQAQFTNKYEAAYNSLQSNPYFNESDWRTIAMGNDASNLDMYIDALSKAKDFDKAKFDETYVTEFQDSDTRLAALYNEVYASRLANDERYSVDVYKYDDTGNLLYDKDGNPKTESKVVSAYEYNKLIISQQNEARRQSHLTELADEAKNPSGWATAGALLVDVAYDGFLDFFNKTGALGKTLIDMARSDKTFANDWFTQWENNYKPILDRIVINGVKASDAMLDFEKDFTHLRDTDGNLTTFGRIATGVASTIGEMLAATITGGILAAPLSGAAAGVGAGAKVAKGAVSAIRTASYYAPLATYSMGEQYKEITANGYSIATSKMLTNQLWKTGLEIGIESGLGKIFGSTGLDKMLFGRTSKGVDKITKANTFKALGHFAGEAVQEGTEEFLQEFSGFLVDTAYGELVDGSFKTEFSMQNLIDAAIIGSLVSATHSAVTVVSTKGKTVKGPDSELNLGKIASAYYNVSIATLLQDLEEAQRFLDEVIDNRPANEKLEALKNRKTNIESDIKSLNDELSKIINDKVDATSIQMAQNLASDIGKGYALNQSSELVRSKENTQSMPETLLQKRESLQRSLTDVDNQIANAQNVKNAVESRYDVGVGESIVSMFQSVYAASRAIQSFAGIIGEERVTKAAEILGRIEKMGDDGKFDKAEVSKARNEMRNELQLRGLSIDNSFFKTMVKSGMSKIKYIFNRNDMRDSTQAESNDDVKTFREFAQKVLDSSSDISNVIITEDGTKVAANEETFAVPSSEAEAGIVTVLNDDAEQRVVQAVLEHNFSGDVIGKVLKVYQELYDENAVKEDAIRRLVFDPNFFMTVLSGENSTGEHVANLADLDMFKFLSSLFDIEKSVTSKNIRDSVYKNKIAKVRESAANSLTAYLIIQPFADYNVSILSDKQITEIKKYRESYAVANRLVSSSASDSDWKFIQRKVDLLPLSSTEKKDLLDALHSKKPSLIRNALVKIDESYKIAFYGAYNGEIYMPLNSLTNRAFNQFLMNYGLTTADITDFESLSANDRSLVEKNYGYDIKHIVAYYSDLLLNFTGNRYRLELTSNTEPDPYNCQFLGRFGINAIQIVNTESTIPYDVTRDSIKEVTKPSKHTVVVSSVNGKKIVNDLLNAKAYRQGANYYDIDDIISNPNLLKKTVLKKISDDYGAANSEEVYMYIKDLLETSELTITMSSDGRIVFANVTEMEKLFSENFSIDNVRKVAKGKLKFSELISDEYDFVFSDSVKIEFIKSGSSNFSVTSDYKGRLEGVIKINENDAKTLEKLKYVFAHEFQHAIQEFNKLNGGNDDSLLDIVEDSAVKDELISDVKSNVPSLFYNVEAEDELSVINEFLYYATAETDAYGSSKEVLDLYPILLQKLGESNIKVTMPWGKSYTLTLKERDSVKGKLKSDVEPERPDIALISSLPEKMSNVSIDDVSRIIDTCFELDEDYGIPVDLKDAIVDTYKKVYKDGGKFKFADQSDIRKLSSKNLKANQIIAGIYQTSEGILIDRDYAIRRIVEGKAGNLAKTMLHEMIHSVTLTVVEDTKRMVAKELDMYLNYNVEGIKIKSLDEIHKAALSVIKIHNDLNKKFDGRNPKVEYYGMTNVDEFLASLVDPSFREVLKKETLWDRIVNAILKLIGVNFSNKTALDAAQKSLETILSNSEQISESVQSRKSSSKIAEEIVEEEEIKIDRSKHARSKGRTERKRVAKKASKGTPLEPFAGKRLSLPLQDFIIKSAQSEYSNLDANIRSEIKNGTLTTTSLLTFLREADSENESSEVTFKLLNDTIFHNKHITSLSQLDEYILTKTANYYAMRAFFREAGMMEKLIDSSDPRLYDTFMSLMENNPQIKSKVEHIANRYWSGPVIDEKNLRRLWMQWFDGSVESAGYVAAVARVAAYQNWKTSGEASGSVSLNVSVGRGKDKSSTLKREDVVPDSSDFEDFNRFINSDRVNKLISAMDRKLVLELVKQKQEGANITLADVERRRQELAEDIYLLSEQDSKKFAQLYSENVQDDEESANALYLQRLAQEVSGKDGSQNIDEVLDDYNKAKEDAKGIVRPKSYVVANIKSINRTIKANLNRKERRLFLKENGDLFDDDLNVKKSLYQNVLENGVVRLKDEGILLEIEERVRLLSKHVKAGQYSDEKFISYKKAMDKKIARIEKLLSNPKNSSRIDTVTFNIVGEEIYVDTTKEMPLAVRRFLETELTKVSKSTTQLLTNDSDVHVQMNYKTFIDSNASLLNSLTQQDVDEIIDFYMSSEILPNTNRAKLYTTVQQLLLGYILETSGKKSVNFVLSTDQISSIEKRLEFMVSTAATMVSTWRTVLKSLKPEESIHKAMLKACDIELSPAVEGELIKAINSGDVNRIKAAKHRAYVEAVSLYKGRKRTIFDRLLRYERMAMLSGPGTWVRNQVSNVMVEGGNRLSELLTSFLPESKKHKKLKQYKIVGTKVSSGYSTWIKSGVIDNGLLDLISDGLIKYDIRRTEKAGVENQLTKLIVSKIEAELFDTASGVNRTSQFLQKVIAAAMSDKRSINRAFIRYLGKMMTEDGTDVSKGLTAEVMDTIAEAYTMAMQDYMHTSNFFNKLEGTLRSYLHKRFNATTADGIYFMYKQVLPFANASWNWFVEGLNYTPVGLAKGIIRLCNLESTVNRMEEARQKGEKIRSARFAEYLAKRDIGKGAIGTVGLGVGILLVALGKADFDEDDDKYKLVVNSADGPLYVDISEIFGTNGVTTGMSIAKNFVDSKGNFNYESFTKLFSSALNTMFMDSTFADMYNTFRYSNSFGDYVTGVPMDIASMFMPNFIKTIGNTFKKYNTTYSPGFLGQLERYAVQSFAPFSYLMPYQINPYTGEPEVVNEGWFGLNIINRYTPVKVKNYNFGDVERIAVSLGVKKSQLTGSYKIGDNKLKLTSEEVENLNEFYGKLNSKTLEDFMMNRTKYSVESEDGKREELTYSKMTDKQKAAIIERIMSNNSGLAKVYILTSSGQYKYYASDSEYDDLRKAGVITNVYRKVGKYEGFVKN